MGLFRAASDPCDPFLMSCPCRKPDHDLYGCACCMLLHCRIARKEWRRRELVGQDMSCQWISGGMVERRKSKDSCEEERVVLALCMKDVVSCVKSFFRSFLPCGCQYAVFRLQPKYTMSNQCTPVSMLTSSVFSRPVVCLYTNTCCFTHMHNVVESAPRIDRVVPRAASVET